MPRFNVLISSAGRRVVLLRLFRQALRELHLDGQVIAIDRSPLSAAFQDADAGYVVPPVTHDEFVPAVLAICQRDGVNLIVPTIDPELPVYASCREQFEQMGTAVAVSSSAVTEIAGDKVRTHEWLTTRGFPTTCQALPDAVLTPGSGWSYPLIVKPRFGSASVGVQAVRDADALKAATAGEQFVVQAVAPGVEYTVDVLADRRGQPVCAIPRRRIEVRAGEVSKGATERRPDLERLVERLCQALPDPYGALNFQVFVDGANLSVIEMNARFGGGYPLSWEAGARFPTWMIEEVLGLPSTASRTDWLAGMLMLRFDDSVIVAEDALRR